MARSESERTPLDDCVLRSATYFWPIQGRGPPGRPYYNKSTSSRTLWDKVDLTGFDDRPLVR